MEVSASKAFQIITKRKWAICPKFEKMTFKSTNGFFSGFFSCQKRAARFVWCTVFRNYLLPPDSGEKTAGICPERALHVSIEAASSHTVNVLSWKSRRNSSKLHRPQTYSFFYWPTMSASQLCWKEQSLKQRQSQNKDKANPGLFFLRFLEAQLIPPLIEFFMEIIVHEEFDLNESCKALFPIS